MAWFAAGIWNRLIEIDLLATEVAFSAVAVHPLVS
jgi:hypothetical protein